MGKAGIAVSAMFSSCLRVAAATIALLRAVVPVRAADTFDWTDLHIGAHGGYALSALPSPLTYDPGTGPMPQIWDDTDQEFHLSGANFDVQLGAQCQIGKLVIGIEADYSAAVMREKQTFATKDGFVDWTIEQQLDFFGTVRGRLGFAMGRLMVYSTGGIAYGQVGPLAYLPCGGMGSAFLMWW